jgi:DNA-binding GntR family transcriptional regulator
MSEPREAKTSQHHQPGGSHHRVLRALRHGEAMSLARLVVAAEVSHHALRTVLTELRAEGLVDWVSAGTWVITPAGVVRLCNMSVTP